MRGDAGGGAYGAQVVWLAPASAGAASATAATTTAHEPHARPRLAVMVWSPPIRRMIRRMGSTARQFRELHDETVRPIDPRAKLTREAVVAKARELLQRDGIGG